MGNDYRESDENQKIIANAAQNSGLFFPPHQRRGRHRHWTKPDEDLVIVNVGTVESQINSQPQRVVPGLMWFLAASNRAA